MKMNRSKLGGPEVVWTMEEYERCIGGEGLTSFCRDLKPESQCEKNFSHLISTIIEIQRPTKGVVTKPHTIILTLLYPAL